jgi:hypothetical protein
VAATWGPHMSTCLLSITRDERICVHVETAVGELHGARQLESVVLRGRGPAELTTVQTHYLLAMIMPGPRYPQCMNTITMLASRLAVRTAARERPRSIALPSPGRPAVETQDEASSATCETPMTAIFTPWIAVTYGAHAAAAWRLGLRQCSTSSTMLAEGTMDL